MSIEEKTKEYILKELIPNLGFDIHLEPILASYVIYKADTSFRAGVEWLLEKAIYWLQDHVNDYLFDDGTPERPWLKCKSEMFDDFKKAMEE